MRARTKRGAGPVAVTTFTAAVEHYSRRRSFSILFREDRHYSDAEWERNCDVSWCIYHDEIVARNLVIDT